MFLFLFSVIVIVIVLPVGYPQRPSIVGHCNVNRYTLLYGLPQGPFTYTPGKGK